METGKTQQCLNEQKTVICCKHWNLTNTDMVAKELTMPLVKLIMSPVEVHAFASVIIELIILIGIEG